ncbi:MAG: DUF938 domain-containing protein [Pseudomonadota bacterium]|nr:DUF938 domain-containing protein [Pseudomonadota bacterium]
MPDARRFAPATERNREPLLAVLARHVRPGDGVLEIASGTGEHAVYFATHLPVARWQPTDADPGARASIDAWVAVTPDAAAKVAPALALDVFERPWPVEAADVVLAVNLIHIAPWEATEALFAGAAELSPRVLALYGPFRRGNAHTAPSNEAFDQWLRAQDPRWGVRDLEAVLAVAMHNGFDILEIVQMPANNLAVLFTG